MPKRTALVIHNTNFSDPSLSKLATSSVQVEALRQVLSRPEGGGYEVKLLSDERQQTLREELVRLYRAQDQDDVVLLAYFGHALLDQFGEIYLAASDTKLEVVDATGLRLGFLRDQLDRSQSAAKLVLLDCPVTAVYAAGKDLLNTNAGMLEALEGNRQGRALLISGDAVEAVLDGEQLTGSTSPRPFAELLVDGLTSGAADLNQDGIVTPAELHEYLYRETLSAEPAAANPRKFTSSNAVSIRLASNPEHQPVELPPELRQALNSPMEWMREGAIGELERLLTSDNRSISRAAREALTSLASDRTPQIARSATAILQRYEKSRAGRQPTPTQVEAAQRGLQIPTWGWIAGGVLLIFAIGFAAGLTGLIGGSPAPAPASPSPGSTQAAAEQPVVTAAVEPTQTAEPSEPAAVALPSSLNMVSVPAGTYPIGANQAAEVEVFWIDQFEITNLEYAAFAQSTGARIPVYWTAENIPREKSSHPVRGLEWEQARAYCEWDDKRLPTEIEWEIAARGPHGYRYPWGDQESAVQLPAAGTHPVGSIPASRSFFGAYDMAGNVWEWIDQPYLPVAEGERVLRGGANNFTNDMLERLIGDPTSSATIADAGFRCAASEVQFQVDPGLLLTDEFGDIQSGWFQARSPVQDYFYGYHPTDFYHVQVSAPEDCLAVRHELELTDFVAEVEIYQAATESEDGNYRHGLMIRESASDYYAFLISPRAKTWQAVKSAPAGIALMDQGTNETIGGLTRETRDRITVIANGAELSFFINGALVSQVFDEDYASGNLGFVVQTEDETYAHIHFDRITVRQLPRNAQPVAEAPPNASAIAAASLPACGGSVTGDDLLESFFTYTVREGDTLSAIANLFGLSIVDLKGANGRRIDDPNVIVVGQTLIIPQQ